MLSSKTYLSHNIFTVSFYFNEYYTYMLCEHCHMCVPTCGSVWRPGTNLGVPAQDVATLRVGLSLRPAAHCRGSDGWQADPRDLPLSASSVWAFQPARGHHACLCKRVLDINLSSYVYIANTLLYEYLPITEWFTFNYKVPWIYAFIFFQMMKLF